jgi:hypothetical protein
MALRGDGGKPGDRPLGSFLPWTSILIHSDWVIINIVPNLQEPEAYRQCDRRSLVG